MSWPALAAAGLALSGVLVLALPRGRGYGRLRRLSAAPAGSFSRSTVRRLRSRAEQSARGTVLLGAVTGAGLGLLAGGPVAAMVIAAYAGFAARALLSRRQREAAARARGEAVDAVAALADDLRAGLAPGAALGRAWPQLVGAAQPAVASTPAVLPDDPVRALRRDAEPARAGIAVHLATAWRLADRTGTPLADLLDRLDAELTAQERVRRRFAAQTAGTRATALLLAILPAIGLAFGYAIGAHPLQVLLHTPIGAACAAATVALQLVGSFWVRRLVTIAPIEEAA